MIENRVRFLFSSLVLLFAVTAHANPPDGDKDPKGYAKYFQSYWEGRINELGSPVKLEIDWKSVEPLDKDRARSIERGCDGTYYALKDFLGRDRYKAAVAKDVKTVRIVDDKKLTEYDAIYSVAGSVHTLRMNLSKFVVSNVSKSWYLRLRSALPSVLEIDRVAAQKGVTDALKEREASAGREDPPRKVNLVVLWDGFKANEDWKEASGDSWRNIREFLDSADRAVERLAYELKANPAETKKVLAATQKITLGFTADEKTPLKIATQGSTLAITLSWARVKKEYPRIEWEKEIAKAVGVAIPKR